LSSPFTGTALAVLVSCFVLNMLGRGLGDTYAVFLRPLEQEFGWNRSQVTGVYSIYLLVNGATAPLVGLFFDRLGPRWVYGAGVAMLGVAFFSAGSMDSLWQFYLFIGVMIGLGVSLNGMVPGSALLARWYRTRLSTALGIAFSAVGIGTIIFVPLTQYLVTHYDWRLAYRVLGGVLLVALPFVLFALPWKRFAAGLELKVEAGKPGSTEGGMTLREAMRTPVFWGLAQVFTFTALGMFMVVVQLVAFFIDAGFSPLTAATAYGVLGMMSALSIMFSGFLSDRFGFRQVATATFIGTGCGMLILLVISAQPLLALLVLFVPVFGLCMGARGPIISSISARYFAGKNLATIYGCIYATNSIGAAVGSFIGGVLHDVTGGYRTALLVALASLFFAARPFWAVPALRNFR
jgi:MFS family permease